MAKLPGEQDLGPTPGIAGDRAIGVADLSGIARGQAAWAQGAQQLGKGIASLGEDVGAVAKMDSAFEYSRAHSDYLTKETDFRSSLSNDQDYTTLEDRYRQGATELRDKSAALITTPAERQRFIQNSDVSIGQGAEGMKSRAFKMSSDANGAWTVQTNNKLIDQATATDDDSERTKYIDAAIANIDARAQRGEITQMDALRQKQDFAHQYALTDGIVRADRDPQGVLNELRTAPGSDDAVTNRILRIEGGGKNGKSSATGAGQFIDSTWLDVLKRNRPDVAQGRTDQQLLALRNDDDLGREMTGAYRRENAASLQKQGIEGTPGNQYLAHFLGPAGAAAVIKADPSMPAIEALTVAVGEKKAQQMVDANPKILNSLSGNVRDWADGLMGGAGGHEPIYNFLPPAMRAQLEQHVQQQLDKKTATDLSDFKTRVEDTLAEAGRNGFASKPMTQGEFVKTLGGKKGVDAYEDYTADMKLRSDVSQLARMTPQQQSELLQSYEPKAGEDGFSDQTKRQAQLQGAMIKVRKERDDDPAQFAISRIPSVQDAYGNFNKVSSDPTANDDTKKAAARDFVNKTVLEQQKAGVAPADVKVLPTALVSRFNAAVTHAAGSDDPNARTNLITLVQKQADLWGDQWPLVYRQMAPEAIPAVRAIAAGADTEAMTRILSLDKDENPAKILREQNDTKASAVTKALNTEMQPFLSSLVGRQKDRDYQGYYGLAEKLAALYVRDGKSESEAAQSAFNALIGNRYDFRDTYRIPKDKNAAYTADDIQAGAQAARNLIGRPVAIDSSVGSASTDLGLTPQEQGLYQRHLTNLTGSGGVDNPNGSRSTLYQAVVEHEGKFYNIPTVWDGKILNTDQAVGRVRGEGWDKFPSYGSAEDAEARYTKMHGYMERDTEQFLNARRANPLFNVKPAVDDIGGLSDPRADSLDKFRRDGIWVTSPDNAGLNLAYGNKFVRNADGKPLMVPWANLAKLGGTPESRAADIKRATDFGPQTP